MSICDSEENRKKLAWLVPGYILLAWFFCVLFQPLGLNAPPAATRRRLRASHNSHNYEIIDLLPSEESDPEIIPSICAGNGTIITLEAGSRSAVIVQLEDTHFHYSPFNCSLQIQAGKSLDGISAVIEHMDLREHEDDVRSPGGHWGSSVCIDYLQVYTENSKVKNKLCGKWNVRGNERFSSEGKRQKLIGYCYDVENGHSCESRNLFINLALDADLEVSRRYAMNSQSQKSFSIVVTGYRHPPIPQIGIEHIAIINEKTPLDVCQDDELACYAVDGSIHSRRPHCIWKKLGCDGHPNCGFNVNYDERFCSYNSVNPWNISTMTFLMVIWLSIVSILVCVTLFLLRWHKALRTPFVEASSALHHHHHTQEFNDQEVVNRAVAAAAGSANGGTVSIMVMYRPAGTNNHETTPKVMEPPPTYDSLFMNESPPNYNMVTVNVPTDNAIILPISASSQDGSGGLSGNVSSTVNSSSSGDEGCNGLRRSSDSDNTFDINQSNTNNILNISNNTQHQIDVESSLSSDSNTSIIICQENSSNNCNGASSAAP
ncbi:uncharacterized protein [Lepeophtheirus salmonis]|uniref:uncharacterized protein n=1 Tax=Lepeophtheirus salmonis TaxID=72036 RepID=UPI001AE3160C|nr:uncharacterized protein LOC121122674 [Lepeophtheirus salmonis]